MAETRAVSGLVLARLDTGRSPSSVGSFLFSPVRPCFPPPEIRATSLISLFPLFFFPPINNVVPPSPTPSPLPFPRRSASHFLCVFVCWRIVSFGLSCQGYRVRVDHLVIDKRMRSGEAGKLNSLQRPPYR